MRRRSSKGIPAWAWPLLAVPVVAATGLWTYRVVADEMRGRLRAALETAVAADATAVHHLHSDPVRPSERLGRPVDAHLEELVLTCLAKRPEERPADAGAVLERLEAWPDEAWTQDQARDWWLSRGAPVLEARRAATASVSQLPELEIDVQSRVRSESRPEVTEATTTRVAASE